ncbi:hypothetical protein F7984_14710 [Pradoshia sp. D12]|uniref:hypothetical protein n=1 Tax=Bacillaceae TaxID=186817 RepID=UPI0011238298|nr:MULTISPECIES: hypothetical protein [Bacillaceae]QFK72403.1 hypothetical protein F7984_14710 [Pradoshia sp. D12]TPF70853.1 hypothetical protein FHY44_16510 [Bacillus sp. D12]
MSTNTFFIRFSISILLIFGGTFTIRYFRTGELLIDQIMGIAAGLLILIASLVWRNKSKQST